MIPGEYLIASPEAPLPANVGLETKPMRVAVDESRDPGRIGIALESAAAALSCAGVALLAAAALRRSSDAVRTLLLFPFLASFLVGTAGILDGPNGPFTPVFHASFLCGLGTAAAALAAGTLSPRAGGRVLEVAALAFLFVLGTGEIFAWGRWRSLHGSARAEAEFQAQVAASVAWAAYAAALLGAGFLLKRSEVRWTGIVLFGVTLAKVLIHDTARLDVAYRILSFIVLGGLLVGASFLYQKRKAA